MLLSYDGVHLDVEQQEIELDRADCAESLAAFVKLAWHVVEPGQEYVHGWHIDFISAHLEAITDEMQLEDGSFYNRLLVNVPPGTMKPVHVNEMIATDHGYKRLRDITVGDMVLTHRGRFRRVTAVHEQGVLPLLKVTTMAGREVRAAPDHPFLTPRGWVQAKDLVVGDYAGVPHRVEPLAKNGMTAEEARLLGYLVGDGCISQRSLAFVNMEADVIDDFIRCAKAVGFYAEVKRHPNANVKAKKVVLKSTEGRWGNQSEPPVLAWLKSHGLYRSDSYTKRIPPRVMNGGVDALRNFIGSYWSCDGTFSVRHAGTRTTMISSATTVSRELAGDLLRALSLLNISARVREHKTSLHSRKQPGGIYTSFNIQTTRRNEVAKFIDMPGLCERKNEIAKKAFRDEFDPVIYEDEIVFIAPDGEGECRCLTVEEDSSFTANSLIVHNSLLTNVFWPAWEWGPKNLPHMRYICAAHKVENLSARDSRRMRQLIMSDWYQARWGDRVGLSKDQNEKLNFTNSAGGFRIATAITSLTGLRADRVLLDDIHSVDSASSDTQREAEVATFLEAIPTRLTNPKKSAIVVIMQRLHERDVAGVILEKQLGYDHIMLPQRFEPGRAAPTMLGYEDPREEDGELLFPERFPIEVVERDERVMGPYATASQFQQSPEPRGGGIIKRDWWRLWDQPSYPPFDYIVASLDTAYTTKAENDPSAMTVWGVWSGGDQTAQVTRVPTSDAEIAALVTRQYTEQHPRVMLMYAWAERLELHDLVERVRETMIRYGVDRLLVENKAAGHSVAQELRRVYGHEDFGVQMYDPKTADKMARLYSVQHIFADGLVFAPDRPWAEQVINQAAQFPRAKHDDLVDTLSMSLKHLRDTGILLRGPEYTAQLDDARAHTGAPPLPLYPS